MSLKDLAEGSIKGTDGDVPTRLGGATDALNSRASVIMMILLMASQVLNQVDRAVLAVAAPDIMRDLGLSAEQYGLLASSFYFLHSITGIVVGLWLAHRVRPLLMVIWLIAIWAVVQIPPLIFASFATLFLSRIVLGAAEGPSIAASVAATHEVFPPERRSIPTSLIWIGALVGAVAAPPGLAYSISLFGWRAGFALCALLSGLLLVAMLLAWRAGIGQGAAHDHHASSHAASPAPGTGGALRHWLHPAVVTITLAGFCSYWMTSFAFSWMFPMFNLGWGWGPVSASWATSFVFLWCAVPLLAVSSISQKMLHRGIDFRWSVILPVATCLLMGAAFLIGAGLTEAVAGKFVLFALGVGLMPVVGATMTIVISHVTPAAHRNKLLLVLTASIAFAGLPAPYVSGLLIEKSAEHGYDYAILCGAAVTALGGLLTFRLFSGNSVRPSRD